MNQLAYYSHLVGSPVGILVDLLIFLIVISVIFYLINLLAPPNVVGPARVVLGAIVLIFLIYLLFGMVGCATMQTYGVSVAKQLATEAVQVVAEKYHVNQAEAQSLASAGLSAAADVAQGYTDKKPPLQVIAASPGVAGVGQKVVNFLKTKGYVNQTTVNTIHYAAQIASNITLQPTSP